MVNKLLTRAQQVGDNAKGGYTVPREEFLRRIVVVMRQHSTVLAECTWKGSETGAPVRAPSADDTGNNAEIVPEPGDTPTIITQRDIVYADHKIPTYNFSSGRVLCSVEFLQDGVSAAETVGDILGQRIAVKLEELLTVGTGSGQPTGFVGRAAESGVSTVLASLTIDHLLQLKAFVEPSWWPTASWFIAPSHFEHVRKIAGELYNMWLPGDPPLLDGHPVRVNTFMPANRITFGSMRSYVCGYVRSSFPLGEQQSEYLPNIEVRRLVESRAEIGQVAFLGILRAGGDMILEPTVGNPPVAYLELT